MNYKILIVTVIGMLAGAGAVADYMKLAPAAFPKTINDVPFVERMQNMGAGYAPFKDAKAFLSIKVESEEAALQKQLNKQELQRELNELRQEQYCERHPDDKTRCNGGSSKGNVGDANENSSDNGGAQTDDNNANVTVENPSVGSGNGAAQDHNASQQQSRNSPRGACFEKNETGARRFIPPKVTSERAYWWIGDSRFVGMYINGVIGHKDNEAVVAFVARGHAWLTSNDAPTGISLLETCLRDGDIVVFNLGANDIGKYNSYISTYQNLMSKYPNVTFKILSVNPVCDSKTRFLNNSSIEKFNSHLKSAFPNNFIDTYSILKQRVSAENTDSEGLHYRGGGIEQTIYDTVMQAVK